MSRQPAFYIKNLSIEQHRSMPENLVIKFEWTDKGSTIYPVIIHEDALSTPLRTADELERIAARIRSDIPRLTGTP